MLKITHNKIAPMTKKRRELFAATKFFSEYLKLTAYDARIVLSFKYGLTDCFKIHACVEYDGKGTAIIEIDADISKEIYIEILAHEMVHVKQYFNGELSWDKKGLQLWKNKYVPAGLKYTEEPWELEAMEKQVLMMYKYIEHTGTVL